MLETASHTPMRCNKDENGDKTSSAVQERYDSSSKAERTPPTGLEPAIFGLGGRRVIHYATEAAVNYTQ